MAVTQDLLLPILFAVIIANVAMVGLLFAAARVGRGRHIATSEAHTRGIDRALAASYVDHSARGSWPDDDAPSASVAPESEAESEAAAEPADGLEPEPAVGISGPRALVTSVPPVAPDAALDASADAAAAVGAGLLDAGLLDASAFHRLVADEDARIQRYHRPATIVVLELDGLDRLVALLGDGAAERIIPAVADTVSRLARSADHVARLGPGRFGVLLPETDEVAAINYIERVRRACELWLESGAIALHLSIGWAGSNGDPTLHEAMRQATERMYAESRRAARRADATLTVAGDDDTGRIAS